ncbi:MAG TPA: DPP IV N-terminal domain-containing protein [Gemmatimonadaceae bacterium]|nr:DPP IV N-terminal domain-containing protein [Gemmatimonadaceae bacterium]
MRFSLAIGLGLSAIASAFAQGTPADYARSAQLNQRFEGLALNVPDHATWIGKTSRFWYRRSVRGGYEFMLADAATKATRPAFDHERLAKAIDAITDSSYTATRLPFAEITFVDDERSIRFEANRFNWRCSIVDYTCAKLDSVVFNGRGGARGRGPAVDPDSEYAVPYEGPWDDIDALGDEVLAQRTAQQQRGGPARVPENVRRSPDGLREAYIQNFNLYVRPAGSQTSAELTYDGSEGAAYTLQSVVWSPDSKKIAVYRVTPGYRRLVRYVISSPADQLQPEYMERVYPKPGDVLDLREPVLVDVDAKRATHIDAHDFPNAYQLTPFVWRKDSHAFTFEYNQRGHQVYRVIEVDAATAAPRIVIDEESKTFIDYRRANGSLTDSGRQFRYDLADGKEIIWMSERDGWSHLYLYDGATGKVKNQITKGPWVVRAVEHVDEAKRQIIFAASGMDPKMDPYFTQYYRINFDGTGLTPLTTANGTHAISFSGDSTYYLDTWSRVDLAPVLTVRRASDQSTVMDVEHGDISALAAAGWKPPEVFVAKGRDGKTDIWGVIVKPTNFDPKKKYPVIENIYAGPQGSFVPKSFSVLSPMRNLAELGFIVVQIDGMGTANRSKAFHDVAWHDLADAGFADRILWHKAVAAKYPWYDISRVGIYGTSAGGQNSLGAMLFHPEFYKAAVSASGCHDNRMDKIWWNEQWMGWPIGPQYAASSNTEHVANLRGDLMLIVGELDTNVDPSSTMQVVNALIKANKRFDLLVIPGADHTDGGPYGRLERDDFFVHHLLGVEPPERNAATVVQAGRNGGR